PAGARLERRDRRPAAAGRRLRRRPRDGRGAGGELTSVLWRVSGRRRVGGAGRDPPGNGLIDEKEQSNQETPSFRRGGPHGQGAGGCGETCGRDPLRAAFVAL